MKNISAWSIKNPIPPIVLFIILTGAGLVGFMQMARDENPNIDLPTVSVTVSENGAAPSELELQVTKKIEDAMTGLVGIRDIQSTISEGSSSTVIEFELGTNTDRAVNDVRDRVDRIKSELPGEIQQPTIARQDVTGNAFATYVVSCASMNTAQLSWYVDNDLTRALLTVPGVGQVQRAGGVSREIEIELNPTRLEAVRLTAQDVNDQVRYRNVNQPGGRGEIDQAEETIRTVGSAQSLDDFKALKIGLHSSTWTRLDSLGKVSDKYAAPRQYALYDNTPVIAFALRRTPGAGLAQVAEQVDKKLAQMKAALPKGMHIAKVRTNATFVQNSFDATIEAMVFGALLAVLTIWFFLKDWRSAAISALAMPLSVIPTFAVMKLLNFTLNNISLLGLALVVGILVDDAIVEIENIVRHMQMGKSPMQAALEAADEIGLAVVATTMSIIAVFLPVAFMNGIPGQFFKQFGITVAVAVFFSLAVARLLTPMMAANWLADKNHDSASNKKVISMYEKSLAWSLAHRKTTIGLAILFFVASLGLTVAIPTNFIGAVDRAESHLTAQLEPGAKLSKSIKLADYLTKKIMKQPEVEHIFASIGTPTDSDGIAHAATSAAVNKAELYIVLKPKSERKLTQNEFEQKLREVIGQLAGVQITFSASQGPGGRLQYCLVTTDPKALEDFVPKLVAQMKTIRGLADVSTDSAMRSPQIVITPNRDLVAQQGVTVQSIARTALVSTLGDADANLGKFDLADRQLDVRVTLNETAKNRLDYLRSLKVSTGSGSLIPLDAIAKVERVTGPSELMRYNKLREVTISAQLVDNMPLGKALAEVRNLPINRNRPATIQELMTGDVQIQQETFSSFGLAIGTALLLMYCVLVLLFNNFIDPLTIMVALPLSLGGAMTALLITQQPLGLYALIGIVMLMGLVAKNAILLVEYALMAIEHQGLSPAEAVMQAGSERMRPILMTTFAMVAGMVPIALGVDAGAEQRAPMAVAVIGGLTTSSILTLVVIPTIFVAEKELMAKYSNIRTRVKELWGRA
ncbi:MAG TPA: efflux RND transporter permease subunit [Oculatellaceae cyanobacterium]